MQTKEQYLSAIDSLTAEINQLMKPLKKSMDLSKDDDQQLPPVEGEQPEMEGLEQEQPEMGEQPMEEPAPEGMEGQEEGQDDASQILELAAQLPDEDLNSLIEMLSQELSSRQQGQEQGQEQAPVQQPVDEMAQKSQAQIADLQKSLKAAVGEIEALKKSVATKPKTIVQTAVSSNRSQAVEKNNAQPASQRLTKSQTESFLLGQIRSGNKSASSRDLIDLNYVKSDEELSAFHERLRAAGMNIPK